MQLAAFSDRDIATRDRLEDYAAHSAITTAGGLALQVNLVCDGAGGGEAGELAARLTARTIFEFLEISPETSVPKLLVKAVEKANKVVYSELRGTGTSTLALTAIHTNDGSAYGRLFIASVGNSRVYLMRDGRLVRLNVDHTLANEYIYAGQMSYEEAQELQDPHYATRAIGIGAEVSVDIGFYVERGKEFVSSRRAFRIGQTGMLLKEGDTVFTATDGLFPHVNDNEFLRHALDDDVERASRSLLKYAADRGPDDNTAISMVFVPSRLRNTVTVGAGLTTRQRTGLGVTFLVVLLVLGILGTSLFSSEQARANTLRQIGDNQTQVAVLMFQLSATPTATMPPTAMPTPTSPPTGYIAESQIGFRRYLTQPETPAFEDRYIYVPDPTEINYVSVIGFDILRNQLNIQPANVYLQPNTEIQVNHVDDLSDQPNMSMVLAPEGDVYSNTGDYHLGGVTIALQQNPEILFQAQTLCISEKQLTPDPATPDDPAKVALTCYTGPYGTCTYSFPGMTPTPFPIGQRVVLDIDNEQFHSIGPVQYDELKTYYDTVYQLTNSYDQVECLRPGMDNDGDGTFNPVDQCPDQVGGLDTFGCPDGDGDKVPDSIDQCPAQPGLPNFNGCLPDTDGDGVADPQDLCVDQPGLQIHQGCPDATAVAPLYGSSIDDVFVMREAERSQSAQSDGSSLAFMLAFGFAGVLGWTGIRRRK